MRRYSLVSHVKLTPYSSYEEHAVGLESCPWCQNTRISKTPRRKGGPAMFHCKKCGYLTNVDLVNDVHRMLGQQAV